MEEGAPPDPGAPRGSGTGEHPAQLLPRRAYSSTLRIVRQLEKHPGVLTAAALGVYVLGFIVVNVHYAQFRLLTFDLVRGQYVAAGLLFLLFTTAPVLTGIFAAVWVVHRVREPGPTLRRIKKVVVAAVWGLFLCLVADYVLAYLYDFIAVKPTMHGLNTAFFYGVTCNVLSVFGMGYLLTDWHEKKSTSRGVLPDELKRVRGFIVGIAEAPMHLATLILSASLFGARVYPGITPGYGGGAAWIAEIFTPAAEGEIFPARWRGALVARDGAYLTVIPCPGALGPEQSRKSVEISLEAVAGWTLLGQVDPGTFLKAKSPAQCTEVP